jgi:hypothetical protein
MRGSDRNRRGSPPGGGGGGGGGAAAATHTLKSDHLCLRATTKSLFGRFKWREMWVELSETAFTVYDNPRSRAEKAALGVDAIVHCSEVEGAELKKLKKKHVFCVELKQGKFYYQCKDKHVLSEWVSLVSSLAENNIFWKGAAHSIVGGHYFEIQCLVQFGHFGPLV